jgi:hypothetical protein
MSTEARAAFIRFRDAVIEFSDNPSPDNVRRYLAASRALSASRSQRSPVKGTRPRRPPLAA